MNPPPWLAAAVRADPSAFDLATAARALPELPLAGPRTLALARREVVGIAADPSRLCTAALGLAGAQSPLPAGMARELARLDPGSAAGGLIAVIERRLLELLVGTLNRRAVDDPAGHRVVLDRLVGPMLPAETSVAGRLCDGPSADAVAARLALAAGCAVRVIAATGGALPLGPGASGVVGGAGLGDGQTVGERIGAPELGCSIELGPVAADLAEELRPDGARHNALLACLRRALPTCLTWELALLVRPAPTPQGRLGRDARLAGEPPACEREILARG